MIRRLLVALMFAAVPLIGHAQQGAPAAGIDYLELVPPQPSEAGDKIDVVEFFWYRCSHCHALEPVLVEWLKKLPKDAQFRRVPAVFNDEWALDAKVFYALEAIGEQDRVHRALFDAIHRQGGVTTKGPTYVKWVAEFLAKQNVDMAKYDAAFRSFSVDAKAKRAAQLSAAYKLDGVPALAVQGRYMVSAGMSGERRVMINVTDYLIGEARKQRGGKK